MSFLLPCTCSRALAKSIAATPAKAAVLVVYSTSRRGFAVTPSRSELKAASGLEDAARTARRAAEQQGGSSSRVGPFPYVEPSAAGNPRLPWRELGGGEKVGRGIVNSSNLLVVLFGVSVTGLVAWAVYSELGENSPIKLYEQALALVKSNPEVHDILLNPVSFHAESTGGRRGRRVRSNLALDPSTGREKMTIHFWAEGKSPHTKEDDEESYAHMIKRWMRPIIVEPSRDTGILVAPSPNATGSSSKAAAAAKTQEAEASTSSWLGSMFGSLLPSAFGGGSQRVDSPPAPKLRGKPTKGAMASGEVVATFLVDDNNKFRLDSLIVLYPDAQNWQWKTDVLAQHQRRPQIESPAQPGPERYRFNSRKVAA